MFPAPGFVPEDPTITIMELFGGQCPQGYNPATMLPLRVGKLRREIEMFSTRPSVPNSPKHPLGPPSVPGRVSKDAWEKRPILSRTAVLGLDRRGLQSLVLQPFVKRVLPAVIRRAPPGPAITYMGLQGLAVICRTQPLSLGLCKTWPSSLRLGSLQ